MAYATCFCNKFMHLGLSRPCLKIRSAQSGTQGWKAVRQGPRQPATIKPNRQKTASRVHTISRLDCHWPYRRNPWDDLKHRIKERLFVRPDEELIYRKSIAGRERFLQMLADLDLKSLKLGRRSYTNVSDTMFLGFRGDNIFKLSKHLSLSVTTLPVASLNSKPLLLGTIGVQYHIRRITIECFCGSEKSFNCLVLGRLKHKEVPTYWIVVLDEDKELWALRSDEVDEEEKYGKCEGEWADWELMDYPLDDMEMPRTKYRKRQVPLLHVNSAVKHANLKHRKYLFGGSSPIVHLGPLRLLNPTTHLIEKFRNQKSIWARSWISRLATASKP